MKSSNKIPYYPMIKTNRNAKKYILILIIASFICLFILGNSVFAGQVWIKGYRKKNGTYVLGYYQTTPDNIKYNNKKSQAQAGYQKDKFSSEIGPTNKTNPSWQYKNNNNYKVYNPYDPSHDLKEESSFNILE